MPRVSDAEYLDECVRLACASVAEGGGPFGALVVQGGRVVGRGANRVVLWRDPTAHAEVVALRAAAAALGSHELAGTTLYASCEPCPMCAGAILWARVGRIVYAAPRERAAAAGFDDARFLEELARAPGARRPPFEHLERPGAEAPFRSWRERAQRVPY